MPPLLDDIPAHVRSMLIFGGTFDPPHIGHTTLPEIARQHLNLDWLLYIPAASPPLKQGPVASQAQRLGMLRCALQDSQHASISTIELARGGTSYTIDTLETLLKQHPGILLRLLVGADQALQFHAWKDARRIIELAEPAVLLRDDIDSPRVLLAALTEHWNHDELSRWEQRFVAVEPVECSSTLLRQWLKQPEQHMNLLHKCIPDAVLAKILLENPYV